MLTQVQQVHARQLLEVTGERSRRTCVHSPPAWRSWKKFSISRIRPKARCVATNLGPGCPASGTSWQMFRMPFGL
jgi:hypothetical protein